MNICIRKIVNGFQYSRNSFPYLWKTGETFQKDWKGGTKEHLENLMQLKVGLAMKLETPEWKVASWLCWFTWQNVMFLICLSLFLILKEKQINFRKMKITYEKFNKIFKKILPPASPKKIFHPSGDGNKQFFYFGLGWARSSKVW